MSADRCQHRSVADGGSVLSRLSPARERAGLLVDADYFCKSREARLGKPLEQAREARDAAVPGFRKSLEPMRQTLKTQRYLGGDAPNYADYIVFGGFQWARAISPFKLLEPSDPIYAWRETLLDAFDGLARKSRGYPV